MTKLIKISGRNVRCGSRLMSRVLDHDEAPLIRRSGARCHQHLRPHERTMPFCVPDCGCISPDMNRSGTASDLTVQGGIVEVAAADLLAVEPEDTFRALPATLARARGPLRRADSRGRREARRGRKAHHARDCHGVEFQSASGFSKQALGLMQLLPETAAQYSVANVFDPAQNIDGGTRYLKDLLETLSRKPVRWRSPLTTPGPTWSSDTAAFLRSRKRRIT